jgi:hypothetical protein
MERNSGRNECEVTENMVELVGLEPTTSSLRTMGYAIVMCLIRVDLTLFLST